MTEQDTGADSVERPAPDVQAAAIREAGFASRARAMERFRFTTTRPVAVLMVFLAVMVFGFFSAGMLPLNLMPDISYPKLTVRTEYDGAAPAEVENDVSRPLEEVLGVVKGVTRISSVSRAGYSDVILEFTWDSDMDKANQDVLEKIDQVKPALPEEIKQPLILRYDPTLDPVLVLSLHGEGEAFEGVAGLKSLRRIADRQVRRLLEPVDGVAAVKVKGGLEEEIHVELDEDALARTGIGTTTVIQRLQAENINLAGGSMREGKTRYLIRTVNEFTDLDQMRDMVVLTREGRDIRLGDLGEVRYGYKDRDVITRVDGREAIEIEVYKEADANIVEMAKSVRARIETKVAPRLAREHGTALGVVADRSLFIESSIAEVRNTAIFGGVLAVVVLFFFLRAAKPTGIVAVAIPISILITFAPLKLAGVSLNIMSLGGLALGIGMLVDNSIVVLESIHRCREEGDELLEATVRGTAEVGSAVVASTLTSIAVFFPMVFVEGVAGQMFGDLGLTVVFSLLASLAVAVFFIPMLASRQAPEGEKRSRLEVLKQRWGTWASFSDFMVSLRSTGQAKAKLLLLPYYLMRLVVHLQLDIVGKLLATIFGTLADVVLLIARFFAMIGSFLTQPLLKVFEWLIAKASSLYTRVIRWSLRNAATVAAFALASFAVMGMGITQLDSELIPEVHQGEFTVEVTLPVGTPLDQTDATVAPIEAHTREGVDSLRAIVTTVGSERDSTEAGERGEHTAKLHVSLLAGGGQQKAAQAAAAKRAKQEAGEGKAEAQGEDGGEAKSPDAQPAGPWGGGAQGPQAQLTPEVAEAEALEVIREFLEDIPDLDAKVSRPVLFSFKTPVEVEIRGWDLDELARATEAVETRLQDVAGLTDVKASIQPGNPEIQIVYDRDALARQGLDIRAVAELVRDKVQGQEATKFNRRDRKVPIRVRLDEIDQAGIAELRQLIVNPGGVRPIPLEAVADIDVGRGPNEIRRIGQQRVGLVTANIEAGGLGSATEGVHEALDGLDLPSGVTTAVTGQSEEWETSSKSLYLALALSIFLVYVIMASQFESLIYPLIILVTIPLALVGVVAVLLGLNIPVSVVVFLGAIMLAGIVVNNAIVLVDYVNQLKARGHATEEALELAGQIRLRPILMTTSTTVLGLLPMAMGLGDGAEIRQPMAITVIAGLVCSTVLTLVVIPTLYATIDRIMGKRGGPAPAAALEQELGELEESLLRPENFRGEEAD